MRNNHRSNNSKCTNSICTFSRIGHNLPNFIPKKISSTRPQRSYLMVDQSLPDYYEKTAKNSDWNSSIHATFSDIFHKIQMTGGGEGERKGGGWNRTVIRIRWCCEATNTFAHVGGGIDTIARLISIGNLLLFVYSKNTLLPREGELRGKSRPAGNFSALILPTVRIIYSIPLRNIYTPRGVYIYTYIFFPYVCISLLEKRKKKEKNERISIPGYFGYFQFLTKSFCPSIYAKI